jgi:hypothetical protein
MCVGPIAIYNQTTNKLVYGYGSHMTLIAENDMNCDTDIILQFEAETIPGKATLDELPVDIRRQIVSWWNRLQKIPGIVDHIVEFGWSDCFMAVFRNSDNVFDLFETMYLDDNGKFEIFKILVANENNLLSRYRNAQPIKLDLKTPSHHNFASSKNTFSIVCGDIAVMEPRIGNYDDRLYLNGDFDFEIITERDGTKVLIVKRSDTTHYIE